VEKARVTSICNSRYGEVKSYVFFGGFRISDLTFTFPGLEAHSNQPPVMQSKFTDAALQTAV
jgi:hypothetical protein